MYPIIYKLTNHNQGSTYEETLHRMIKTFRSEIIAPIKCRWKIILAWKNTKQRSLAESMLIEHDPIKELDEIYSLIDWSRIEQLLTDVYSSPRGNKAWPPVMMFRGLLLQSWYKLSDEGLEKQWACDVLFRHFTGLDISEPVPANITIWRFRQKLNKDNLMD